MTSPTPSIRTMAESLVVTAGQAIKNGVASDDTYRYRLATCFNCEQFNHKTRRCGKCGCFMAAKARIAGDPRMLCPLHLWQR
ncbi:MAG: hypothetical protein EBS78_11685 [Altererythrobacter sp.]|nr:hypothetical protein [Altererythrobacter sp.]